MLPPFSIDLNIRLHAFSIQRIAFAETIDPEANSHAAIAFSFKIVPLAESVGISILPREHVILIPCYPYNYCSVSALEFRVELHLFLRIVLRQAK